MKKLLLLLFLFAPSVALGQVITTEYASSTQNKPLGLGLYVGNHTNTMGFCVEHEIVPTENIVFHFPARRYGTLDQNVYGVIFDDGTQVATSTNYLDETFFYSTFDITNYLTFDYEVTATTTLCIGVILEGGADSSNYVRNYDNGLDGNTVNRCIINSARALSCANDQPAYYLFSYQPVPTECEDSGTMECDMASTTEAIYTVGYSVQMYLGVLLLLIFGYLSYIFFRGYIKV